nr:MAG TPA: hypothetical protein [Caudoviricetes sp.]
MLLLNNPNLSKEIHIHYNRFRKEVYICNRR